MKVTGKGKVDGVEPVIGSPIEQKLDIGQIRLKPDRLSYIMSFLAAFEITVSKAMMYATAVTSTH